MRQVLQASYVVGCDGGRSFTRENIGATLEDLGFHEEWLIVDLLLPEKESELDRYVLGTASSIENINQLHPSLWTIVFGDN